LLNEKYIQESLETDLKNGFSSIALQSVNSIEKLFFMIRAVVSRKLYQEKEKATNFSLFD